jgi:hypothetical protein
MKNLVKIENKNRCFGSPRRGVRGVKTMIFIFIITTHCYSQKEDYHWLGGIETNISGGINGYILNFNEKPTLPEYIDLSLGFTDNNASISDKEGNLLFYFNGCAVFNKYGEVMPNGDSINAGVWFDKFWKDCRYGYPGFQDVLIINDPKNNDAFYLFHKPNIYYPNIDSLQLQYTYIDMRKENGYGDVTSKNNKYYETENPMYSYFTGIKHQNKNDWWLIQPIKDDSIFLTFLLSKNGIERKGNQKTSQYFDDFRSSASGNAKFSPDGTKYALYNYYDQLHLYDFDRNTGILSNHKKIKIYDPDSINRNLYIFSSVEWSPNSRFIYCASSFNLHQVDTWNVNMEEAIVHIDKYNGTLDPFQTRFFLMAQAPDCKIYMTPKNGSYSIHVINKPDELGKACDFVQNGIKLPAQNSGTLPNFPRFRVDEEQKCDPTITSVFGEAVYFRKNLEVYPNPSFGLFTIKIPEAIVKANVVVSNINGQVLLQKKIDNSIIEEVDITSFPAGRYNIDVYPEENKKKIFYGKQVIKI